MKKEDNCDEKKTGHNPRSNREKHMLKGTMNIY